MRDAGVLGGEISWIASRRRYAMRPDAQQCLER
jgi:hypothetical protein